MDEHQELPMIAFGARVMSRRNSGGSRLILSGLALLCAVTTAVAADCGAGTHEGMLGLQKGLNVNHLPQENRVALSARVADYVRLGVKWVRFDFDWSLIQPVDRGSFRFEPFDAVVQALSAAGIN